MSKEQSQFPGIAEAMMSMARRDLLLAWKRPGDVLNPLFFFAMVCHAVSARRGPECRTAAVQRPRCSLGFGAARDAAVRKQPLHFRL